MDLEEDARSFSQVLHDLSQPENRRDPRALRLAAVASTMMEVAGGSADCTAAKVYAKAVTALEGALVPQDKVADSIQTQVALLQILSCTVQHVTPPAILQATFPLASRVIRAVIAAAQEISADISMETNDGLGGVFALLKNAAILSGELLKYIPVTTDTKAVKHFLQGTLMTLFNDPRPKVWKTANSSLCELMISQSNQVVVKMLSSHAHNHLAKAASNPKTEVIESMQQLLNFLEHSILYMNYEQLGADVMKLLVALMEVRDSGATEFVTVTKVRDATPRVLVIGSLLTVVTNMLEDDSEERKAFLDGFASRIIATQLQLHPKLAIRQGMADSEIIEHCKIQYGQTLLMGVGRLMASNSNVACKLLPITIQMLVLLSCPSEDDRNDSAVGESLLVGLTQLYRTHLLSFVGNQATDLEKCLKDTLRFTERVMEPSYIDTYGVGLKSLAVLIKTLHSLVPVEESFRKLVNLRNAVPLGSSAQRSVEDACVTVVQEIGIESAWMMLDLDSESQIRAIAVGDAWLLSTFKAAANALRPVQPHLGFFQSHVLTMARKFDKLATTAKNEKQAHRQRVVDLWALFPCFCKFPSDIETTIIPLSLTLVRVLQDQRYPELVPIVCGGVKIFAEGEDSQREEAGIVYSRKAIIESAAANLLPCMFKLVSESGVNAGGALMSMDVDDGSGPTGLRGQQVAFVTESISSLAKISSQSLLRGLFQKLMHRLLGEIQVENANAEKICSLLSLSESLVASKQMDESSIAFLYRALKPLIRTDEHGPRVQKKAYKTLAEVCRTHHAFVVDAERMHELVSLLTATIMSSQIAARYMRLTCLELIIEGIVENQAEYMKEFSGIIGELLLCLKDTNAKTREAAFQVILSMYSKSNSSEFLCAITAGLGAETPHMRSASVTAISRITFTHSKDDVDFQNILPSILKTVLVLAEEDSREVIKSVLGFIRVCVSVIPYHQLSPLLPDLVRALLTYQKNKDRFRSKIKIIVKKLVKIFGYDTLTPYVPVSESRLLTHMRKLEQRQKRKKDRGSKTTERENFDDMLESDEEDSDDGVTFMSGMTGLTRLTGKSKKAKSVKSKGTALSKAETSKSRQKGPKESNFRLSDGGDGDVVDMLGSKMSKNVHFADNQESEGSDIEFDMDNAGKLIIRDEEDEPAQEDAEDTSTRHRENKRRRLDKKSGLGASYKSKKAGGDVKKKGQKYEPYAFMPLDGRSYTKKNRGAMVEQMSTVVRGRDKRKRR